MIGKKKLILSVRIALISLVLIILHFSFSYFNKASNDIVLTSSTQSLKETSELYAQTFAVKINDQLSMLESQTRFFANIDMNDYAAVKNTIVSTKGIGGFKRIAVANNSGMTINYQGNTSGNIFLYDFFTETMKTKKPTVSKDYIVDEDGENVLTLAVPIIQNDKTQGVITGTFSQTVLQALFSVESFNGKGYSHLVDLSGKLLVESGDSQQYANNQSILDYYISNNCISDADYHLITERMHFNKSGLITITNQKGKYLCYFTPVGFNNWYVLSYIDASYVMEMKKKISHNVYLLVMALVICFLIIGVIIFHLLKEFSEVQNDVEKYAIASKQNQSCIFEYDLKLMKIKFSGNYEYVLGKIENPIPIDDMRKLYVNIHKDDRNVMNHIQDFLKGEGETFTSELRFNCSDNQDKWFKLTGTSIKDKDGKLHKFVGNFTNVDAQVTHEQELKHIAETDLLSGLLNKSFFTKNVSNYISKTHENSYGAFFIIDLDNFKQTNDTLGHAVGDIAIKDTAKKLNLTFSAKDIIGRIGGDEFCVFMILENVPENVANKIIKDKAQVLNETLKETYKNDVNQVSISASIGITLWPSQGTTYEQLFLNSDKALYYVKNNGKNGNAVYSAEMNK